MSLQRGIIVGLVVCLLGGGAAWRFGPRLRSAPSRPPVTAATVLPPTPAPNADGIGIERDRAAVFQRAFWRRPTPADRILQAERRDWQTSDGGVEKWQWFIAVEPSAAFRDWLLKENPFELVPVAAGAPAAALSSAPDWFPSPADLPALARYRNREGKYQVFHDVAKNRLYATDAGGGFAAASR